MISYNGSIYVEAAIPKSPYSSFINPKHKRCEKGTHYNYKKKKCEKLPPELAEASAHANHLTSLKSGLAAGHHKHAYNVHAKARRLADKHGFSELGNFHEHRMAYHSYHISGPMRKQKQKA